jgi:hypothetical protein
LCRAYQKIAGPHGVVAEKRLPRLTIPRRPRSQPRNSGFLVFREATMSCCRSAAARSSSLVRNMSATNPAAIPEGRSVSVSARRAHSTRRPMAAVSRLAKARSTWLISSTEATTSSLALGDFLNDSVTDEPGSQDRQTACRSRWGERPLTQCALGARVTRLPVFDILLGWPVRSSIGLVGPW